MSFSLRSALLGLSLVWLVTSAAGAEGEFKPLFNGKDFAGWRFSGQKEGVPWPENWKVKDGVISLTGGGKPHLVTVAEFGDFEMKFEWRALRDKYNSGFFIRCKPDAGNNQINLAKGAEGGFVGGKVDGAKPVPELQKPAGEWNEWRVVVKGDRVSYWCNGKLAWEATGLKPEKGHIGLQAEGAPIEFRNLQLREPK
ncbi:MAG: DUF1080 domain-containing protein [Limisphaerales bacterium]